MKQAMLFGKNLKVSISFLEAFLCMLVVVGLVLIFKGTVTNLFNSLFSEGINSPIKEILGGM